MLGTGLFAAHKNKLLVFYNCCQVLRAQNHNATQLPQLLAARAAFDDKSRRQYADMRFESSNASLLRTSEVATVR